MVSGQVFGQSIFLVISGSGVMVLGQFLMESTPNSTSVCCRFIQHTHPTDIAHDLVDTAVLVTVSFLIRVTSGLVLTYVT